MSLFWLLFPIATTPISVVRTASLSICLVIASLSLLLSGNSVRLLVIFTVWSERRRVLALGCCWTAFLYTRQVTPRESTALCGCCATTTREHITRLEQAQGKGAILLTDVVVRAVPLPLQVSPNLHPSLFLSFPTEAEEQRNSHRKCSIVARSLRIFFLALTDNRFVALLPAVCHPKRSTQPLGLRTSAKITRRTKKAFTVRTQVTAMAKP